MPPTVCVQVYPFVTCGLTNQLMRIFNAIHLARLLKREGVDTVFALPAIGCRKSLEHGASTWDMYKQRGAEELFDVPKLRREVEQLTGAAVWSPERVAHARHRYVAWRDNVDATAVSDAGHEENVVGLGLAIPRDLEQQEVLASVYAAMENVPDDVVLPVHTDIFTFRSVTEDVQAVVLQSFTPQLYRMADAVFEELCLTKQNFTGVHLRLERDMRQTGVADYAIQVIRRIQRDARHKVGATSDVYLFGSHSEEQVEQLAAALNIPVGQIVFKEQTEAYVPHSHSADINAVVDMLVCTRAEKFVGFNLSTFTHLISAFLAKRQRYSTWYCPQGQLRFVEGYFLGDELKRYVEVFDLESKWSSAGRIGVGPLKSGAAVPASDQTRVYGGYVAVFVVLIVLVVLAIVGAGVAPFVGRADGRAARVELGSIHSKGL